MKKRNFVCSIILSLICLPALAAEQKTVDSVYQDLLTKLKKSYVSLMITERQTEHLRDSYLICQQKIVGFEQKQQQLQAQLDRQKAIFNSASSSAEKQVSELEQLSIESKQNDLGKKRNQCDKLSQDFPSYESELNKESAFYQQESRALRDKMLDYLLNKHIIRPPSVSQSIDHLCQSSDKKLCFTQAKAKLIETISQQRTAALLVGTVFEPIVLQNALISMPPEHQFKQFKVVQQEYSQTEKGDVYNMTINARFSAQQTQVQNKLDKMRIGAAIDKYLQSLKKKFNRV